MNAECRIHGSNAERFCTMAAEGLAGMHTKWRFERSNLNNFNNFNKITRRVLTFTCLLPEVLATFGNDVLLEPPEKIVEHLGFTILWPQK